MIAAFINKTGLSGKQQERLLLDYALACNFAIQRFIKAQALSVANLSRLHSGDVFMIEDVTALGNGFEEVIQSVNRLAQHGVRIYIVNNNLQIDTMVPQAFDTTAQICLQLYKAVLSVKNKNIQENLLKSGKKRGRPFKGDNQMSSLADKDKLIKQHLSTGMSKRQLAAELGCGYTSLLAYIKKNQNITQENARA